MLDDNDQSSHQPTTEFAKELGLTEAISIAVGAMIGGGIFTALGRLSNITGPSAFLSFFLGGIIAFLTANSYYRLVSKYPSAGGEFVILRRGFSNPLIGNSTGAMLWLGYSVTIALYAFTFGNYVSEFIYGITNAEFYNIDNPALITGRKIFSFLSIALFMYINLRGVKETGIIQNAIVSFKVMVLLFVGILGLALLKPSRYDPFTASSDAFVKSLGAFSGFGGILIGGAVVFVSYEGFQVIANTVEEMKNPARDVKLGMYGSVIAVTVIYILVTIATFSLVSDIHNITETALINAVAFLGTWATLLVTLAAAASTTSAINATLLGSSRLAYVMSDWNAFPRRFAVLSKSTKVPYLAIIITSLISWLFTFFGNAAEIAEVGSILFLGIFLTINISVLKIFPTKKNEVAKTAIIAILSYIILVLIFFSTHWEHSKLAILVLVIFSAITIIWMLINQKFFGGIEINESEYLLDPLGKDLIPTFQPKSATVVDDFFLDLNHILVPVIGAAFERQNWELTSLIAKKYNAEVTILHIGKNYSKLQPAIAEFEKYGVHPKIIFREISTLASTVTKNISTTIIKTYEEGDYQLICMASRRKKGFWNRLLDSSVGKEVVDHVRSAVLQVHPPNYGFKYELTNDIFLLFDGSIRDSYLSRWGKLLTSIGKSDGKVFIYHITEIPQTISLEDASQFSELKESAANFKKYALEITSEAGLAESKPILLYGHNFVKALRGATRKHEPNVIFIGHTKDSGFWDRFRTKLAYRIMNKVPASIVVYHTPDKQDDN